MIEAPSASLLKPIGHVAKRNVNNNHEKVVQFTIAPHLQASDEEGEPDVVVAKMPHLVSRSPKAVGKVNIINLAIGAQISK